MPITRNEMRELIKEFFDGCMELIKDKGADYAVDDDALRSFRVAAKKAGISTIQVALVHMSKQMDAIETYVRDGQLTTDSILSRLTDVANYAALMWCLLDETVPMEAPSSDDRDFE